MVHDGEQAHGHLSAVPREAPALEEGTASISEAGILIHVMRQGGVGVAWLQDVRHVPRIGDKMKFQDLCDDFLANPESVLLLAQNLWAAIEVVHHLVCHGGEPGKQYETVWLIVGPVPDIC